MGPRLVPDLPCCHDGRFGRSGGCGDGGGSGNLDAEMLARAQLGMVLVLTGDVSEGLGLLDGAATAAVAGEIAEPGSAVAVCCMMTAACVTVRDLERAEQWSAYAMRIAADRGGGRLFDYPRTDRASLLINAPTLRGG